MATAEVCWWLRVTWWNSAFFFDKWGLFFFNFLRIGPIIRYSRARWPFWFSPGSRCRSHLVNSRKRWPSPFRPIGNLCLLWSTFAGWSPLFWQFLGLWCTTVNPCFIDSRKTTQKLLQIALKHPQTQLWISRYHGCACYSEWVNAAVFPFSCPKYHTWYDTRGLLRCLLPQQPCTPSIDGPVILHGSRYRSTWIWLIKNKPATTLKSLNPFLTVAIEGEESPYAASKRSFSSLRHFPSKNKNRVRDQPTLFHFSKIRVHVRFHTRSKQNY